MKHVSYFLIIVIGVSATIAACTKKFEHVENTEVDVQLKKKAERFAVGMLSETFSSDMIGIEATEQMTPALSAERRKKLYQGIRDKYGTLDSTHFIEVWRTAKGPELLIYRLKGYFSDESGTKEIRVVFDKDEKLAGFWIKPFWSDVFM